MKKILKLTKREIQLIREIGKGKTNDDIAKELGLTWQTVRRYIRDLYFKLYLTDSQCNKRVQLALMGKALLKSQNEELNNQKEIEKWVNAALIS